MPHSFFVRYMSLSLIMEQSVETVPSVNDIFVKQLHECTWRGVLLRMENYGFSMKCLCNGSIRKKGRAAIKHLEDKHRDQLSNINITFVKKQNSHGVPRSKYCSNIYLYVFYRKYHVNESVEQK